jgi:hypothetical protein
MATIHGLNGMKFLRVGNKMFDPSKISYINLNFKKKRPSEKTYVKVIIEGEVVLFSGKDAESLRGYFKKWGREIEGEKGK